MSACILSGFSRAKKYVGVIYACDGSDLPSTQDFGTVQYQGPSETALSVPATTVDYAIIGKTPCGDTIRRITTRTYSSREVASQYKVVSATLTEPISVGSVNTSVTTGYGATQTEAAYVVEIANIDAVPDPYSFVFDGKSFVCTGKVGGGAGYGIKYTLTLRNGVPILDTYILWRALPSGNTTYPVTIYYLDVNEVWTYDLV